MKKTSIRVVYLFNNVIRQYMAYIFDSLKVATPKNVLTINTIAVL